MRIVSHGSRRKTTADEASGTLAERFHRVDERKDEPGFATHIRDRENPRALHVWLDRGDEGRQNQRASLSDPNP
jgi:hypothetical protein